ncbi:carotenoid oxygenase family protein [Pseudobacteriovorax antillogorgiicola]|uniref:Retinal pigment epithelial membrane protein n=1 Tax=Pseudobacteriovorax antillogorgiicola TaxID=1513793 RepID=A0A1Y6CQP5_9BACT|nr:carotenoid oxygenase family protein [Pseudobacteriovorax antillogorgiicola]TCS42208.1 retinal pigment epithelial membrane protein [Pseudobacteriovorax antillogorgiicola]SMF82859.1 Retinal pigment epithelial membrane protein [Pseudobacteriovorax antillogorgiicola]
MEFSRRTLLSSAVAIGGHSLTGPLWGNEKIDSLSSFPVGIMNAPLKSSAGSLDILEGDMPDDIFGHYFFMEGIALETGHFTPAGRGAICRVDFNQPHSISFKRALVQTPSAILMDHVSSSRDQFKLYGSLFYLSSSLGFMNFNNTAPIWMGDNRIVLTFEGGQPHEIDPLSLEVVSSVGTPDEWRPSINGVAGWFTPKKWLFPQVRTTAHPYFDERNGDAYTVNYGGLSALSGFLNLVSWDRVGRLKHWRVKTFDGSSPQIIGTVHSIAVTENLIIIFDTAARVEFLRTIGLKGITPQTNTTPTYIIRKKDLRRDSDTVMAHRYVLPFDTSDVLVDYDDQQGSEFRFFAQYLSASDKSEPSYRGESLYHGGRVDESIAGYPIAPHDIGGIVSGRVDLRASEPRLIDHSLVTIRDEELCWDVNDPIYYGHYNFPNRFEHIFYIANGYRPELLVKRGVKAYRDYPDKILESRDLPKDPKPSALFRYDCNQEAIVDSFQFPEDAISRSGQYLKKKGDSFQGQKDGYIICPVFLSQATNPGGNGKELWVFAADNLSSGPVCKLGHPDFDFAATNHAMWVPSIGPRPEASYKADSYRFYEDRLDDHSEEVRRIVRNEVYPRIL